MACVDGDDSFISGKHFLDCTDEADVLDTLIIGLMCNEEVKVAVPADISIEVTIVGDQRVERTRNGNSASPRSSDDDSFGGTVVELSLRRFYVDQ